MLKRIFTSQLGIVASIIFLALSIWWVIVNVSGRAGDTDQAELFSAFYGLMALYGGVIGLGASRYWGGFKSKIGKAVGFISLGLLFQELGQITYSMYTYLLHVEIPYPSLGDIGYFGSVILYLFGAYYLISALNPKLGLKSVSNKILVVILPVVLLTLSYIFLLQDYEFDGADPLAVFLDFGYPLGQAAYISLGLMAFILSRNYLGGVMKPVLVSLIFALLVQYISDFTFIYQVNRELWQTAGFSEYMYLASYFIMTIVLLSFTSLASNLRNGSSSQATSESKMEVTNES